ncbi:VOC family protein [Zhihengliuella flava]|uniref:Catechol 2,3-dioxygenase-like lactoylglutathione lyase family enzyme n=1 Tax=Zhihengliuella flava TaxID=1285193 RepID=A0A931GEY4_9MICC|nr:VOC family protein [Zhihengliuella flava]MBG6084843.1 catechol 2,3-dioxygenase-like lactoylglutathione lyase family enzyme [Zhihengliuella flava]
MRVHVLSVFVADQAAALEFYTGKLGFVLRHDIPLGADRWLTVVAPDQPEGPEVLLEPNRHPAAQQYQEALAEDGIPAVSFAVDDVAAEHARLTELGVDFTQAPVEMGPTTTAVFDDTCGNLVQLVQMNEAA